MLQSEHAKPLFKPLKFTIIIICTLIISASINVAHSSGNEPLKVVDLVFGDSTLTLPFKYVKTSNNPKRGEPPILSRYMITEGDQVTLYLPQIYFDGEPDLSRFRNCFSPGALLTHEKWSPATFAGGLDFESLTPIKLTSRFKKYNYHKNKYYYEISDDNLTHFDGSRIRFPCINTEVSIGSCQIHLQIRTSIQLIFSGSQSCGPYSEAVWIEALTSMIQAYLSLLSVHK